MGKRAVVGATGFTGRLTCAALAARGVEALLVGRSEQRLAALRGKTGFDTAMVTDASDVEPLIGPGDVVVSLTGPFVDHGYGPLRAAISRGAHYIDSTGEHPFIRSVIDDHSATAERSGVTVVTAMAADWVPGNLAGATALAEAPTGTVSGLEIRYVITGPTFSFSTGSAGTGRRMTQAPVPGFAWRGGALVEPRPESIQFDFEGETRTAHSASGSEHLTLPQLAAGLRDIWMYLSFPPALPADAPDDEPDGPGERNRSLNRQRIEAKAFSADGAELACCVLDGPNGYDYSGAMLAWAAERMLAGEVHAPGVLGPVSAFGLTGLSAGSQDAGMQRVL
jgi:short subunit dehydrogenase-like uncharacterized protein